MGLRINRVLDGVGLKCNVPLAVNGFSLACLAVKQQIALQNGFDAECLEILECQFKFGVQPVSRMVGINNCIGVVNLGGLVEHTLCAHKKLAVLGVDAHDDRRRTVPLD